VIEIPDLTYFIGRPFLGLEDTDESWRIVLDAGGVIENKDLEIAKPDEEPLKGTVFIRPIFSELDTRLQFGVGNDVATELTLNPLKYTISDPSFSLGAEEELYPQVPVDIEATLPPDPSDERVADGPEVPQATEEEEDENA